MTTAGISTGNLVDNVILGLAQPFQRSNCEQLTRLAHDSGEHRAMQEVLSYIRQYSRLNPRPDGASFAATGRGRKFTANCHYSSPPGHMQKDCSKKKADEKAGRPPPRGDMPQPPVAALVCNGAQHEGIALVASHSDGGVVLYDSCCTHHPVNGSRFLENFGPSPVQCMRMGGNEPHVVEGQGTAVLLGNPLGRVELRNVLYVPTMVHNLCSRSQALSNGAQEEADVNGFALRRPGDHRVILTGETGGMSKLRQRLQVLTEVSDAGHACVTCDATSGPEATCGRALAASASIPLQLAHERLGHMNIAQVKRAAASDAVTGLHIAGGHPVSCMTCNEAKQTRGSFPPSTSRATRPLEIIRMDTIGPT